MKRSTLASIFLASTLSLSAQVQTITTPKQPVAMHVTSSEIHVLTNRIDVNFNGQSEAEDSPAQWIVIDRLTLGTKSEFAFPWANVKSSRPAFSTEANDKLFIGVDGALDIYKVSDKSKINTLPLSNVNGVGYNDNANLIVTSHNAPDFVKPGTISLHLAGGAQTMTFDAGINPQQIAWYNFGSEPTHAGFAVVNEGVFGSANGRVEVWENQSKTAIDVGDTPNHVTIDDKMAYVTVNGSHWIVVIDLEEKKAVDTILVGTSGFEGPRESCVHDGRLFVSTFAAEVRIFDLATGDRAGRIALGAKPEAIAVIDGRLWVTRAFVTGGYDADSGIDIYNLDDATSVADNATPNAPKAYPLPAASVLTVDGFDAASTMQARIVSPMGTMIDAAPLMVANSGNRVQLDVRSLPNGVYTLTTGRDNVRFVVAR